MKQKTRRARTTFGREPPAPLYSLDRNTRSAVCGLAIAYEAYYAHRANGDHARAAVWGDMALRYQLELGVQLVTQKAVDYQQQLAGKKDQAA